ncbi:MAG: hypothetical protein H6983_23845 [Ectothiorhodospiraceae bacterium]|nr:hypothetical protein [Ectothiorhodospiraceae bacterium]
MSIPKELMVLGLQANNARAAAPVVGREVALKDNSRIDYTQINTGARQQVVKVVSQFPAQGEEVPRGTRIDLVTIPREAVGVGAFAVDERIKVVYGERSVVDLSREVEANDRVKEVFDAGDPYEKLTEVDKKVVDDYLIEKQIAQRETPAAELGKLFGEMQMVYKF